MEKKIAYLVALLIKDPNKFASGYFSEELIGCLSDLGHFGPIKSLLSSKESSIVQILVWIITETYIGDKTIIPDLIKIVENKEIDAMTRCYALDIVYEWSFILGLKHKKIIFSALKDDDKHIKARAMLLLSNSSNRELAELRDCDEIDPKERCDLEYLLSSIDLQKELYSVDDNISRKAVSDFKVIKAARNFDKFPELLAHLKSFNINEHQSKFIEDYHFVYSDL